MEAVRLFPSIIARAPVARARRDRPESRAVGKKNEVGYMRKSR